MKKDDLIELTIEDLGVDGEGIGKVDGMAIFVKDAVPGDRVQAKVMKMKKSYGYARLMQVLDPSPERTESRCAFARQCGGCQLQAMTYEAQLDFKAKKVWNHLIRIGGITDLAKPEIIGMDDPWRYRNKAQFPFGTDKEGNPVTGFYAARSHNIIPCTECWLGVEENKVILEKILDHLKTYHISTYDEVSGKGLLRHVLIRKGFTTGEVMVCLILNGRTMPKLTELVDSLREVPGMTSITINVNTKNTNVIMGTEMISVWGQDYITDYIGNIKYQISPLSFYQVNPVQTKKLYETALGYADLKGNETVWDLYCGIGTISLFLAQKAGKVYGVEIVPQAIDDARQNAKLNGIKNAEFFVGKAEEVLPEKYEKEGIYADVIVVDPPRKGCDTAALETMVKMKPERIVYVSCDSATLARDVKWLGERGYEVKKVKACDMFPGTVHVETVVKLSLKKDAPKIEITMEPDEESNYTPQEKAIYSKIKEYVKDKYGVNVHTSYIAQVKRMCGLDMGENYNKSKKENPEVKQCPQEKVEYIKDALRYFKLI
ncbi:23S rRNA (uracil(1939)-C(5))-methyltransferase RlmD [Hominiventricola aquisgranensis]|uniref:23S rRNA (Uracil(1939)-C(5))-methyltransferase RlmD n=1 Tax=Hominiventricola aquisgranensis TaxID=3133164 RepID=A0ABV1I3T8_9FIRM